MLSTFTSILRLIVLAAAAAGSAWAAVRVADTLEARNASAVERKLGDAGLGWAQAKPDGMVITLTGMAPDEPARFRALTAAGEVVAPRRVRDRMVVADSAEVLPVPDTRLEIQRMGDQGTIFGLLPAGPETLAADLTARFSQAAGGLTMSDLLSRSTEDAPPGWDRALDVAERAIAALEQVRVALSPDAISVTALARDAGQAATVDEALRAVAPTEMRLDIRIVVPRPVVAPFLLTLRLGDAGAQFDACVAATKTGRERIHAAARDAGFAGAPVACTLAVGAPSPDWDAAAAAAIDALARIGAGAVTVSDLTIVLETAEGSSPEDIAQAVARLEADLPAAFSLDILVPEPKPAEMPAPTPPAEFVATRSPEGLTILRGTAGTDDATDVVQSFAASRLAAEPHSLHLSLAPVPAVPSGWAVRVLAGLDAFAELDRGMLRVTEETLSLTGATVDPDLPDAVAVRLREALGTTAPIALDIRHVAQREPEEAPPPVPEECLARVTAIQERTKITFDPGATELNEDAAGVVRRIAAVMRECPGVAMEIAGHTDSQGRDEMNLTLSNARAAAVLEALLASEVPRAVLTATGYGESRPIADNATSEGREANRRIEFRLRFPLQGPPPPPDAKAGGVAAVAVEDTDGTR